MPLERCDLEGGGKGWRWGGSGRCYADKKDAIRQAVAISYSQGHGGKLERFAAALEVYDALMKDYASPGSATSGLASYDLEGQRGRRKGIRARRIKRLEALVTAFSKYSDDQPRDEQGRWTDGGGGSGASSSGSGGGGSSGGGSSNLGEHMPSDMSGAEREHAASVASAASNAASSGTKGREPVRGKKADERARAQSLSDAAQALRSNTPLTEGQARDLYHSLAAHSLAGAGMGISGQDTSANLAQRIYSAHSSVSGARGGFWFDRDEIRKAAVDVAADRAATSSYNSKPQPTKAQRRAGNYAKGHVKVAGLDVAIENPAGSVRRIGWPPLPAHYGYIKRTEGADGDAVDAFVRVGTPEDWAGTVHVIDQVSPQTREFDEHKVMLGWDDEASARAAYLRGYEPGWKGLGVMTSVPVADFKTWLKEGDLGRPFASQGVPSRRDGAREHSALTPLILGGA